MPKVVGETPAGELIFEIQSVRLILRPGAGHFNRLVQCAQCGRDAPGRSVLSPADLGHSANSVICKECVKVGASTSAYRRDPEPPEARAPEARATDTAPESLAGVGRGEGRPADDRRLASLERTVAELVAVVEEQRTDLETALDERMGSTLGEVAAIRAHGEQVARAQEDVNDVMEGIVGELRRSTVAAADLAAAESRMAEAMARVTARLDDRVEQLSSAIRAEAERTSAAIDRAETGNTVLREAQLEIGRQLEELAQAPATTRARVQAVEERLQQVEGHLDPAKLTASVAALARGQLRKVEEELHQRLDQVEQRVAKAAEADGVKLTSFEHRIEERLDRLTERAEEESELRVTLARRVEQLQTALERQAGPAEGEAESTLAAAVGELARELQQLKAHVAELEETAGAGAAPRAWSQASAPAPLSGDLRRMEEQLAAHDDALTRAMERLRRTVAAPGSLAEPAPTPSKN